MIVITRAPSWKRRRQQRQRGHRGNAIGRHTNVWRIYTTLAAAGYGQAGKGIWCNPPPHYATTFTLGLANNNRVVARSVCSQHATVDPPRYPACSLE